MRRIAFMLAGLCCVSLVGCSGGGAAVPKKAQVSGSVTLDGKPMAEGQVRFNVTGQAPIDVPVKDGAFSGEAFTGENRIDVLWEKEGPPHPMDPNQRIIVNVVDARFSGPESPFKKTIAADGAQNLSFQVTSAR